MQLRRAPPRARPARRRSGFSFEPEFDQRRPDAKRRAARPGRGPDRRRASRCTPAAASAAKSRRRATVSRHRHRIRTQHLHVCARSRRVRPAHRAAATPSTWPPTSMKNAYCHRPVCAGRDSMRFMLTPCRAKRLEHAVQRAGLVADEHQQRGAVVARRREQLAAEHQEARGVVGAVLDRAGDDLQAVDVRRRSRRRSPRRRRRCARGARLRHCSPPPASPPSAGAGAATPCTAPATARANRRARCPRCGRVRDSRYWCTRSSTSPQIFSGEVRNMSSVDWIVPCPEFSTGTTPKSAWPASTSSNTSSMLASGRPLRRMAEVLVHRLLRERAFRAEVADLQRLLLGQAGRHDFAEQAHQHFVGERAVVAVDHPAQHLRLALGPVVVDRRRELALGLADLPRPTARARRSAPGSARSMPSICVAHRGQVGLAALHRLRRGRRRFVARRVLRWLPSHGGRLEIAHEIDQRLHAGLRHRVVDRRAHAAERAVALQREQARRPRLRRGRACPAPRRAGRTARSCASAPPASTSLR